MNTEKCVAHFLEAVVQQRQLVVAAHDGRGERVLGEATPRLLLHEQELPSPFLVAVRQAAHRVAVAPIGALTFIRVLPLVIIFISAAKQKIEIINNHYYLSSSSEFHS